MRMPRRTLTLSVLCLAASAFAQREPARRPAGRHLQRLAKQVRRPREIAFARRVLLGTDALGGDVLSQMLWACRLSISISLVSTGISVLIGVTIGAVMGYFGGKVDAWVTTLTDSALAFPQLILLLGLRAVLKFNLTNLVLILAVLTVPAAMSMFWKLTARVTAASMKCANSAQPSIVGPVERGSRSTSSTKCTCSQRKPSTHC